MYLIYPHVTCVCHTMSPKIKNKTKKRLQCTNSLIIFLLLWTEDSRVFWEPQHLKKEFHSHHWITLSHSGWPVIGIAYLKSLSRKHMKCQIQHKKNNSKCKCIALLVYGAFLEQKSMLLLQWQSKRGTIYGFLLTVMCLWWRNGRSPINRTKKWYTASFCQAQLGNYKPLSLTTDLVFILYMALCKVATIRRGTWLWQMSGIAQNALSYIDAACVG